MIQTREHTILLVSDDLELCAAARHEFEAREEGLRVAAVRTVDAARRIVEDAAPSVILLEQTSAALASEGRVGTMPRLDHVVSSLAIHAPVVVIGAPDQQAELALLVQAGAADFVERTGGCFPKSPLSPCVCAKRSAASVKNTKHANIWSNSDSVGNIAYIAEYLAKNSSTRRRNSAGSYPSAAV